MLAKNKRQDDQLSLLLSQLGGLSADLEKVRSDTLGDIPPPPPMEEEQQVKIVQKQVGGVRILPPGSKDLGNGWLEHTDPKKGKKYYENTGTGVVQWTPPA